MEEAPLLEEREYVEVETHDAERDDGDRANEMAEESHVVEDDRTKEDDAGEERE